jgi:hypothetical protein
MSLWGNQLLLIYMAAPVTALFVVTQMAARHWLGLRRVLLAAVLGGMLSLIFLVPVALEQLNLPIREGNEVHYSADLLSAVTPSFYHPLFGQLDYTHRVLGIEPFERVGYLGIGAAVLALVGVWKFREARGWLVLGLIAWVFSLGPLLKVLDSVVTVAIEASLTHVVLPWAALNNLPLLNLSRTPTRFNMTVALALAITAGYGAAVVLKRLRRSVLQTLTVIVLIGVILFEYQFFWPVPTIPGVVPEPIRSLAGRDDVRAVFNIPWEHLLTDKVGLFLQTGHQRPMLAGHVTRRTPVDPSRLSVLQATLDYRLLDAAGADIVILHKEWGNVMLDDFSRERLGQPFYEDARIAAFDVPDADAQAAFVSVVGDLAPITDTHNVYFYTPQPGSGQVTLRGQFRGEGLVITFLLDGVPVETAVSDDLIDVELPLTVSEAGYHTVTLAVEPSCPVSPSPLLTCRAVHIESLVVEQVD